VDVFAISQTHSSYGINTDKVNAIGLIPPSIVQNITMEGMPQFSDLAFISSVIIIKGM